jgi:acetyltransferase-like isoleucine patch superfamily enzyme
MRRKWKFLYYAWKTSLEVSKIKEKMFFRFFYFIEIAYIGLRYNATTIDYMELKYYDKNRNERKMLKPDLIIKRNYINRLDKEQSLFAKYGSCKYQNPHKWHIRYKMYKKTFNLGEGCSIGYNVMIRCTHDVITSKFICGNKVSIQRNVDIDYTGDLEIGNNVKITEGVKILTHGHDHLGLRNQTEIIPRTNRVYLSKLVIENNVLIGVHAIIMPGVGRIGENSIISAGSLVSSSIPPNVIVAGNPAKIIAKFPIKMRLIGRHENDD